MPCLQPTAEDFMSAMDHTVSGLEAMKTAMANHDTTTLERAGSLLEQADQQVTDSLTHQDAVDIAKC